MVSVQGGKCRRCVERRLETLCLARRVTLAETMWPKQLRFGLLCWPYRGSVNGFWADGDTRHRLECLSQLR